MYRVITLLLLSVVYSLGQNPLNLTGRASLRATQVDYDEVSKIKPDSIPDAAYGKTTLIPGLQQNLNLALFARTEEFDLTLLGDIRNNDWNRMAFSDLKTINRLSLSARFGENEIVLGDFFETGSELFVQSREIRGGKAAFHFEDLWTDGSYMNVSALGGIVQKAFAPGSRLLHLYKSFETSGQYRRYFFSSQITAGQRGRYYAGIRYLQGNDEETSVSESINEPLFNTSLGGHGGLYLFDNRLHLFGEGYFSQIDTLDSQTSKDNAYKAGLDLRMAQFKLVAFYQRLGFNYFSAGYPYLLNDRQGLNVNSAYNIPGISIVTVEVEQYKDNLEDLSGRPTTETRLVNAGISSQFPGLPEITLRWGYRDDNSNTIIDQDDNRIETAKISRKYESRIAFNMARNRFALSTIYMDLDDCSLLAAGSPLGTAQLISSMNLYTRPFTDLYVSGGIVFSSLRMTNNQENENIYLYESSRWDIIPRRLKLESTLNFIKNEAANGGIEDMLSDYWQVFGEISLEYFFNNNLSLKLIGGTDTRQMRYTTAEALEVITMEYGPTFFNSNETYDALIYGLEMNWLF